MKRPRCPRGPVDFFYFCDFFSKKKENNVPAVDVPGKNTLSGLFSRKNYKIA